MPFGPGLGFAIFLNGAILLLGLLVFGYWLKERGDRTDSHVSETEEWHQQASVLAREVKQVAASSAYIVDPDRLRRQLLPLAYRIQGHVRAAPSSVDSRLLREFYDLSQDCYRLSMEHSELKAVQNGVFLEDKLADIQAAAEDVEEAISIDSE